MADSSARGGKQLAGRRGAGSAPASALGGAARGARPSASAVQGGSGGPGGPGRRVLMKTPSDQVLKKRRKEEADAEMAEAAAQPGAGAAAAASSPSQIAGLVHEVAAVTAAAASTALDKSTAISELQETVSRLAADAQSAIWDPNLELENVFGNKSNAAMLAACKTAFRVVGLQGGAGWAPGPLPLLRPLLPAAKGPWAPRPLASPLSNG